jgi:hypothetical protein
MRRWDSGDRVDFPNVFAYAAFAMDGVFATSPQHIGARSYAGDRAARSIPTWLAEVVQAFELDARQLVTVGDVYAARPDLIPSAARHALTDLVRRGWLSPTGVRGVYEFIPGAVAGPYPSGDPWLVLRAELARHPEAFHPGATSAAWLRGYAQRSPQRQLVVAEAATPIPRALDAAYRVLRTSPAPTHDQIAGLPVPTAPELFAETAQLAPRLELDAARGWLRRLLDDTTPLAVAEALRGRRGATRARAGYMAELYGTREHAAAIAALGPVGTGPFFTGPRSTDAPFAARWRVYDSGRVAPPC